MDDADNDHRWDSMHAINGTHKKSRSVIKMSIVMLRGIKSSGSVSEQERREKLQDQDDQTPSRRSGQALVTRQDHGELRNSYKQEWRVLPTMGKQPPR